MSVVRVIHWRAAEAEPLLGACRAAGFEADYLERDGGAICRAIRSKQPAAIVIDLSRRPSHGREVAVWVRNTKSTRQIPIVFVGGEAEKVGPIRELLPDASYCEIGKVAAMLKKVTRPRRKGDPLVPVAMMARVPEKSAAQKLGIGEGAAVAVVEPPRDFPELLGALPEAVEFQEDDAPITLWFVYDRDGLFSSLRQMRTAAGRTRLWLLWRKGAIGSDLTQNALRETAREVGLVDYKICSVDDRWSAMAFARKKA